LGWQRQNRAQQRCRDAALHDGLHKHSSTLLDSSRFALIGVRREVYWQMGEQALTGEPFFEGRLLGKSACIPLLEK
jgi:hypothetical protein